MSLAACFDELSPRASGLLSIITRLVLRLVSHLGGHLVVPALSSMCFSCVFSVHSPASYACLICPRTRLVVPSRLASRAAAVSACAACLIGSRWRLLVSSYRLVERGVERGETVRFRNLFHGIFMYSESIAVLYRAIDIMGNVDMYMAEREPMNIKIARLLGYSEFESIRRRRRKRLSDCPRMAMGVISRWIQRSYMTKTVMRGTSTNLSIPQEGFGAYSVRMAFFIIEPI